MPIADAWRSYRTLAFKLPLRVRVAARERAAAILVAVAREPYRHPPVGWTNDELRSSATR